MVTTFGKCCICGFELQTNSTWQTESEMNNHVKEKHPSEHKNFRELTSQIELELTAFSKEIWKKRKPLYMTTIKGKEPKEGTWNY